MAFQTPPPNVQDAVVSFPTKNILLVTLNRPKSLNCINTTGHYELDALWNWLDNEPSLLVGIVTGAGRAFCAGADLKECVIFTLLNLSPSSLCVTNMSSLPKPLARSESGTSANDV